MDQLKLYSKADIMARVNFREGETRLGERVQQIGTLDQLQNCSARFVLIGIPEDIGVRANAGLAGAASTWQPALNALLNIQSTGSFKGEELLVLGHFEIADPADQSITSLQQKVTAIDNLVYPVIQQIIAAEKIPIVIGGGHNNAYPIIKGCALALNKTIDVINIDAHADLRATNGRHSGNGFSYAIKDGFLMRYALFGLHENYNNSTIIQTIGANPHIYPVFFDELLKSNIPLRTSWDTLLHKTGRHTGLELDLDSIANTLSSAMGPSGFTLNEIRSLILTASKDFSYLHLCEAAVALADGQTSSNVPKAIAYLISDFIRSNKKSPAK